MNRKQIGKNIQIIRKERNITQEQLAEKVDVSKDHISHIETGSGKISLNLLLKLCAELSVTPNDILIGEYLLPNVDEFLFHEKPDEIKIEDKLLLQQIYEYMKQRRE